MRTLCCSLRCYSMHVGWRCDVHDCCWVIHVHLCCLCARCCPQAARGLALRSRHCQQTFFIDGNVMFASTLHKHERLMVAQRPVLCRKRVYILGTLDPEGSQLDRDSSHMRSQLLPASSVTWHNSSHSPVSRLPHPPIFVSTESIRCLPQRV